MNLRHFAILALIGLAPLAASGPAWAADPRWSEKVTLLIKANFSYPRSAELRGESGRATVKIKISGAGKLLSVDLLKGSGSAILDREALRIPQKIRSYPLPPGGSETVIVIPITWKL